MAEVISNTEVGRKFENYIASLYRAMGYRVEQNCLIAGQQIDIKATRVVPGAGEMTVIIECKFKKDQAVSNQEAIDFLNSFRNISFGSSNTSGVLVTNQHFSKECWSAAQQPPKISLKTQRELELEIFDVHEQCYEQVIVYEKCYEHWSYVPLAGEGRFPGESTDARHRDLESAIISWIGSGKGGLLTLLADFGAGKTTLLRRINWRASQKLLCGEWRLIPLLINLRNFSSHSNFRELVKDTLLLTYRRNVPDSLLTSMVAEGRFLLLLDGFDEISTIADEKKRANAFFDIAPFINSESPCLLTSRETYFISIHEYNGLIRALNQKTGIGSLTGFPWRGQQDRHFSANSNLASKLYRRFVEEQSPPPIQGFNAGTLHVLLFNNEQIDNFLAKHERKFRDSTGKNLREIKELIGAVYDLSDLITRPLLLSMIVETITSGYLGNDVAISAPSDLYQIYTTVQLDREFGKGAGRQFFTTIDRRRFCHLVALSMLQKKTLQVSNDDLLAVGTIDSVYFSSVSLKIRSLKEEEAATDIRVCSFLTATGSGMYKFAHKSYMEFFVAQYVKENLLTGSIPNPLSQILPVEIINFLSGFVSKDLSAKGKVEQLISPKFLRKQNDVNLTRNLLCLSISLQGEFDPVSFLDVQIFDFAFKGIKIFGYNFQKISMVDITFDRCEFRAFHVKGSRMDSVNIKSSEVASSTIGAYGKDCAIAYCDFHRSNLTLSGERFSILESSFVECNVDLTSTVAMSDVNVNGGNWRIGYIPGSALRWSGIRIHNADVKLGGNGHIILNSEIDAEFHNCSIYGIVISKNNVIYLERGEIMNECSGVIFVRSTEEDEKLLSKAEKDLDVLFANEINDDTNNHDERIERLVGSHIENLIKNYVMVYNELILIPTIIVRNSWISRYRKFNVNAINRIIDDFAISHSERAKSYIEGFYRNQST